jgi:opacity protein-like surface antigen
MKIRLALATVAFSLMTAAAAHAALPVTVDVTGTGNPDVFDFSLTNTDTIAHTIDEISISPSYSGADSFTMDLFNGWPTSSLTGGIVLDASGGANAVYTGNFTYDPTMGDTVPGSASDIVLVAKSNGNVIGQTGGPVPEPGSVALLISTTMGGGLLMARRRRK